MELTGDLFDGICAYLVAFTLAAIGLLVLLFILAQKYLYNKIRNPAKDLLVMTFLLGPLLIFVLNAALEVIPLAVLDITFIAYVFFLPVMSIIVIHMKEP